MVDNQAPPPLSSPTPASPPAPPHAAAARRPTVIPDLNYSSTEVVLLANVEEAVAALPGRVEALRRSYDRLVASSPFPLPLFWSDMESYLDSVQGYISRGLDSLQEAVLRAGPSLSSHVGLTVEVAREGREEGASVFAKQDGGDGAATREEAPPGGDTVIASVEEEEIKAAAEEEVVVNQNGMEVAAKKVRNHANASTRVGMKSNGKGESPDLDSGEVMAIEDGKEKVVSAIEPSKPEPEQGAGMSVMETMVETEDATKKASQERIRHAFDTIDKVALESPTQKLTLEKKVGIPLMDWTKKKEGEFFEMPLDQFNEETAMEAGSIQEDDAQGEDMDICSEEGEVHIETKKKKVAIDMQDDGMLVGGIKAEAREKKTRTRTSLEEDAKVATDNVGANAGAGRQERRHRQREPVPRRQLVAACERMGSFDLAELVLRANRSIAGEFLPAMRCAPDAPALALHVTGHLLSTDPRDVHSASWENLAVLLRSVRSLATTSRATAPPPIDASAKEATTMAKMWSAIIAGEVEYHPVAWGHSATWALLQFVAAYGIAGNLEVKDMMLFHTVGDRDGGAELIRSLGLADKATELINHLLKKGKHINAIKVVRAFNLIDKFPPVSIIKAYVQNVKEAAQDMVSKDGVSLQALNHAMEEDVAALRSAKEAIESHDNGSDYRYTVMQEVHKLMRSYEKKKRTLSIGSTSSSQEHRNKKHRRNQVMHHGGSQTIPAPPLYIPFPPAYLGHFNPYHPFGPQSRHH